MPRDLAVLISMEKEMRSVPIGLSALLFSVTAACACGVERWPVKVGEDRDVAKVATEPRPATIAELAGMQPPANPSIRKNSRYSPVELTTYEISGRLTLIKLETRQTLDARFGGPITSRLTPDIPVTVTGVGVFDKLHGQEGKAPNGIELHPILEIVFE